MEINFNKIFSFKIEKNIMIKIKITVNVFQRKSKIYKKKLFLE